MFTLAVRRAAPRVASNQQKRGIVDYLVKYPDRVRTIIFMSVYFTSGGEGGLRIFDWDTVFRLTRKSTDALHLRSGAVALMQSSVNQSAEYF